MIALMASLQGYRAAAGCGAAAVEPDFHPDAEMPTRTIQAANIAYTLALARSKMSRQAHIHKAAAACVQGIPG